MSKILIVEDEPDMALGLRDNFEFEGYEVTTASDGQSGLEKARALKPDLLVLDVMLPKMSGLEVCKTLRGEGYALPILMLTARGQEIDKVMGLELGADDYVTKPYGRRELQARVKALLRRSAEDVPETSRFGDVEVDFARGEIRRGGRIVDVTPLEFRVLATFVRHPGRVLTRQQLLDEAWGRDLFVTDRVVDNQVTNLRKKIEPDPSRPRYVVTVAGQGYRLDGSR